MTDTPRQDAAWEDAVVAAVNAEREALGLDPLDAEFGWRGFPDLSPDFLRRKAMRQLRDRFGRWRDERGHLEPEPTPRRRASTVEPWRLPIRGQQGEFVPEPGPARATPSSPGKAPEVPRPPRGIAVRVDPQSVEKVLNERGGWTRTRAKQWAERGAVFEYGTDGGNPIFVFVADEKAVLDPRMERLDRRVRFGERQLAQARKRLGAALRRSPNDASLIQRLERAVMDAEVSLVSRREIRDREEVKWRRAMGITPKTTSPEFVQQLAEEAGAYLDKAVAGMPEWKKKSTSGFMAEFDEAALMGDEMELVPAQAQRGKSVITLHRGMFHNSTSTLPPDHEMPTGAQTYGEYSIPHESGHLVDENNTDHTWSSMQHEDVWRQAIATGQMSEYGKVNPREGYAEAFAIWQHDPSHPVARMYADRFQWGASQRTTPGQPDEQFDEDWWESLMEHEPSPSEPDPFFAPSGGLVDNEPPVPPGEVQALPERLAAVRLMEAGFDPARIRGWVMRGTVYQYGTEPGENPIFTFAVRKGVAEANFSPNPEINATRREVWDAETALRRAEAEGTPEDIAEIEAELQAVQGHLQQLQTEDDAKEQEWLALIDLTDENTSPEFEAQMSNDAGARLAQVLERAPAWRKQGVGGFMLEFDESTLFMVEDDDGKNVMAYGQALRGGQTLTLHRGKFYSEFGPDEPITPMVIKTGATRVGDHTVPHEFGHLMDTSDNSDPYSSQKNQDIWAEAIARGLMSDYGMTAPQEGYAEAFAAWIADPDSQLGRMYAERFGWDDPLRHPGGPGVPQVSTPDALVPSTAVQRFAGPDAIRAMTEAGFNPGQARVYAAQGEVFTRDGKVWSFHPFQTARPLVAKRDELQRELDRLWTNPNTRQPYRRLPAARKERVQEVSRAIHGLNQRIAKAQAGEKKLRAEDVSRGRALLREMEKGIKKLPRWRRDTGGPWMIEADPDISRGHGPRVIGVAVMGSNTLAINQDWMDPAYADRLLAPRDRWKETVLHELGHNLDLKAGTPGSSTHTEEGQEVWEMGKTLDGMTLYGRSSPAEGYAEMYRLWAQGERNLPAVQLYAKAYNWGGAARKIPTKRGVRAQGRRLAPAERTPGGGTSTGGSSWSRVPGWESAAADVAMEFREPEPTVPAQRLAGPDAVLAMEKAGFPSAQARVYAAQGEVFTRDGKVWSFHPYSGPSEEVRREIADIKQRMESLQRHPYTKRPYTRMPAENQARFAALEQEIDDLLAGEAKLRDEQARNAEALLTEMEQGVGNLPSWRRDTGGPFMAEVDLDIGRLRGQNVAGISRVGSNTISINGDYMDPAWQQRMGITQANWKKIVVHELGHVADGEPNSSFSSTGTPAAQEVYKIAKTLPGMTDYGLSSATEGYAEMFRLWVEGSDAPAVRLYAEAFGWSEAQRKVPTVRGVRTHADRLAEERGRIPA